jgi:thiamine-monophosphate kinase
MRESNLLNHIYAANRRLTGNVVLPPGDDMGGVRFGREVILAGVDQLVDGRHFRSRSTPLELVGRKAITRCLSDAAAMAAWPVATLVAASLPPDFGEDRAKALFDAMRATCEHYESPLIGGDIAFHADKTHPLVISTTVLAVPTGRRAATRGGAEVGDGVFVTGPLGGSLQPDGLGRHLTFEPRIKLASEVRTTLGDDGLHAMIDISDGLGRDASHIAEMSGVQIILDAGKIPCNPNCTWRHALSDGEDYELLFCAKEPFPSRIFKTDMIRVGEVVKRASRDDPYVLVRHGQNLLTADDCGWEHASNAGGVANA